jgi:hypothetical protein
MAVVVRRRVREASQLVRLAVASHGSAPHPTRP